MQVLSLFFLLLSSTNPSVGPEKTYSTWPSGARYLIISYDSFIDAADSLARWKSKKGMLAKAVPLSQVGYSSTQIKSYVTNAYNNWDPRPEFLLLFGGAQQIPYGYEYGAYTDCYYTNMDSDLQNEIIPGRLPATNTTEAWTMVAKTINYERNPYLYDTLWYLKGTNIIREDGDWDDTLYWGDALHAETLMVAAGYISVDTFSSAQGDNWYDVRDAVNEGRTYVQFRGQSTGTWWSPFTPNFSQLTNGWKLPIIATFTCAQIDYGYSNKQEKWVRIGTPDVPRGAVGVCGPTTTVVGFATARSAMSRGFFDYVFMNSGHGFAHFGTAVEMGRIREWQSPGDIGEGKGLTCIGDPELNLWTGVPQPIQVSYPSEVPPDSFNFTVSVSKDGEPVENALVCVMIPDSLYAYGYTDVNGEVTLEIAPSTLGDTLLVTVTARNAIPHEGISLVTASGVGYTDFWIDDSLDGNGDGIPNPGESPYLGVTIKNFGLTEESGLTIYLLTSDPYITMIDSVEYVGDLSAGDSVRVDHAFKFSISSSAPHNHPLGLSLEIEDKELNTWVYSLPGLNVVAAELSLELIEIKDTLPEDDDDGLLDPGERGLLSFSVKNTGGMTLSNGDIVLIPDPGPRQLQFSETTLDIGSLDPGDSVVLQDCVLLKAHNLIRPGDIRNITIQAEGECETYTYEKAFTIPITVGDMRKFATGPDSYGYYAYDLHDSYTLQAPEYDWFEIAPPGPGQIISQITNEDADTVTLSLPFTFKFYGIDYNSVGVCSNGFLEMGQASYRYGDNVGIPQVGGPKRLIAPFWDDIDPSAGGDIYQYYDEANHRWIVEFKDCVHYGDGNPETFQVILFDPSYYSTPTGDGEILFLYKTVNDPSSCTVGIEDHSETVGIQYLYNGSYDQYAHPLESGSAILFSTSKPGTRWPIKEGKADYVGFEDGDSSKILQEQELGISLKTELIGIYPSVIKNRGQISFSLNEQDRLRLSLYDIQGRGITLINGTYARGTHSFLISPKKLGIRKGVYFIRMETKSYKKTLPFIVF